MSNETDQKINFVESSVTLDHTEEFIELFTGHSLRIYRFIRSLVQSEVDADEVYQNVCSVLWAKFSQFQLGTSFWGWACKISRYEVLAFRRQLGKQPLHFSDQFYRTIADEAYRLPVHLDRQLEALSRCFSKLTDRQKELVELKYRSQKTVRQVASLQGRSVNAIYKSLYRIHQSLHDCISRQLELEDSL